MNSTRCFSCRPSLPHRLLRASGGSLAVSLFLATGVVAAQETTAVATPGSAVPPPAMAGSEPSPAYDGSAAANEKAERPKNVRVELGGRVGYALPFGKVVKDLELGDLFTGAVPLQFDGWLRLFRATSVGLYAQIAPGISGKALDDCNDCSVLGYRLGLQVARHFNPGEVFDPWIGAGIGYQAIVASTRSTTKGITGSGNVVDVDVSYDRTFTAAPELLVQAGLDIGGEPLSFGPFVAASWARASKVKDEVNCTSFNCSGSEVSYEGDIDGEVRASQYWFMFGIRGSYLR